MAKGLSSPQEIVSVPTITTSPDDSGASFVFSCDDFDGNEGEQGVTATHDDEDEALTDRCPAFLHPHSAGAGSLRIPTMASDDGPTDGGAAAPALKNPFNFQTQVISTSPVKSVCLIQLSNSGLPR